MADSGNKGDLGLTARQRAVAEAALAAPAKGLPRCHRDVILLWPSLVECARETGIAYESVKAFARRNSIGDEYRPAIVRAAAARATVAATRPEAKRWSAVTFEMLTRTAPRHAARAAAAG